MGNTPSIEDYFREFAETTNVCHFSDCVGFGLKSQEHGVGFKSELMFKVYYRYFKKYMSNADLVIEMQEEDYLDCKNLKHTLKLIDQYKNNMN